MQWRVKGRLRRAMLRGGDYIDHLLAFVSALISDLKGEADRGQEQVTLSTLVTDRSTTRRVPPVRLFYIGSHRYRWWSTLHG